MCPELGLREPRITPSLPPTPAPAAWRSRRRRRSPGGACCRGAARRRAAAWHPPCRPPDPTRRTGRPAASRSGASLRAGRGCRGAVAAGRPRCPIRAMPAESPPECVSRHNPRMAESDPRVARGFPQPSDAPHPLRCRSGASIALQLRPGADLDLAGRRRRGEPEGGGLCSGVGRLPEPGNARSRGRRRRRESEGSQVGAQRLPNPLSETPEGRWHR